MPTQLQLVDEIGQIIVTVADGVPRPTRWWAQQIANYIGSDVRVLKLKHREVLEEQRYVAREV